MSVDYKSAKHLCNVIRRQVDSCFSDLHMHFTIHNENERAKAFSADAREIGNHPAGKYVLRYPNVDNTQKIMEKNRTRFVSIARYNSPGFLGFFQSNAYMALCFVNYTRFETLDDLRNHLLHISWHAIALYKEYEEYRKSKNGKIPKTFIDDHNILIPNLTDRQLHHRNLIGDIFSASVQTLQGRDEAFKALSKQRIIATLSANVSFRAEEFPFPMCIDTLEYLFNDNIVQYKKSKRTLLTAVQIAEDIGDTYEAPSIEQWRSFSFPAQQMAWAGFDKETILGAALYTGESTYAQSIADMISENIGIKPKIITNIQDYNPFTNQEANTRLHKKLCKELLNNLQRRMARREDFKLILEIIDKQNQAFQDGKLMGWCVPALVPVADMIKKCSNDDIFENVLQDAITLFEREVENIEWDTLSYLSKKLFYIKRDYGDLPWKTILQVTSGDDEFSSIHSGLVMAQQLTEEHKAEQAKRNADSTEKKTANISDFISPHAIKR
mgnify:FL=1